MKEISPAQVTEAIRTLFRPDDMVISRCYQVLEGVVGGGKIFVDNPDEPTWAAVQEPFDHPVFLSGYIEAPTVRRLFTILRKQGEVLAGLTEDDPRIALLPPSPDYDGFTLEFYERTSDEDLEATLGSLPPGCELRRLDRQLIMRTEWGPGDVLFYGGAENWEKTCLGYVLMRGDEILSEATVGSHGRKSYPYELGVFTQEKERGKGYGTLVVRRLAQEIESRGGTTFWNCARQNKASAAIARKLGYRVEKEFRCLAWNKIG